MTWCVYRGKKGKTKASCHRTKRLAKKAADRIRAKGGHARLRKTKG